MPDAPRFPPMPGSKGFVHPVDEAPAYWMQGILWTMLADAEDTGGRWSMMEQVLPASMEVMIAELGQRTNVRTLPPPGPPMPPGKPQMPADLLARYGLMWLDEPDPLAPRGRP